MRLKFTTVVVLSMLFSIESNSQSFLESLGRSIGQSIRKEVSNKIGNEPKSSKDPVRGSSNNNKEHAESKPMAVAASTPTAPGNDVDSPFVFAGGSGTMEDPYLVQTAEQLNAVRKGPQHHYKLIADIDLSTWGNWVPIGGTSAYGFMAGGPDKASKGLSHFKAHLTETVMWSRECR